MADNRPAYYRTPFDPPDEVTEEEFRHRAGQEPLHPLDPSERIPGAFGAVHVIDRTSYPGSFLDSGQWGDSHYITGSNYNVPHLEPRYSAQDNRQQRLSDLNNPMSKDLGIQHLPSKWELILSTIMQDMQRKGMK